MLSCLLAADHSYVQRSWTSALDLFGGGAGVADPRGHLQHALHSRSCTPCHTLRISCYSVHERDFYVLCSPPTDACIVRPISYTTSRRLSKRISSKISASEPRSPSLRTGFHLSVLESCSPRTEYKQFESCPISFLAARVDVLNDAGY